MTNLGSILKSRDITLPTKVRLVKAMVFPVVMYGCESWTIKKAEHRRIDASELWCWWRAWESLGLQGDPTSTFYRKSVLDIHWKDWYWSWNSNTLATWCKELTHSKRPLCWERWKVVGEGDDRGLDGWMASPTRVWVNSGSCDGQGGLACCSPRGCKELDTTEPLNWTESNYYWCLYKIRTQKETPGIYCMMAMWRKRKKVAMCMPRREALVYLHLDIVLPVSRTRRK